MKRGFTLIEMLLVIAILAILISLLVPLSRAGIDQARAAECASRLSSVYEMCMAYATDHDGFLPEGNGDNPGTFKHTRKAHIDRQGVKQYRDGRWIDSYIKQLGIPEKVWYCPYPSSPEKKPEYWMDMTRRSAKYNEFQIGYFYIGNLTGAQHKIKKPWPKRRTDLDRNQPLAMDQCTARRPCPAAGPEVDSWIHFPHHGTSRPGVCNILTGDGSVRQKSVRDITHSYSFIGPANVFW